MPAHIINYSDSERPCLKSRNRTWRRSVPQRGSAWLGVGGVDLRSFRRPDPLATRYRAVVLTSSKHGRPIFEAKPLAICLKDSQVAELVFEVDPWL